MDDKIRRYIVALGQATRNQRREFPADRQGDGAARGLATLLPASAGDVAGAAFFRGRDYVMPSDIKFIATDVLHHRLVRTIRAEVENVGTDEVVAEVLRHTPIP